jgi:5-methylcytosine-specific restriction endonuclease McrA
VNPTLFDDPNSEYEPRVQTFDERYRRYINSSQWKKKRQEAIARAGNQCHVCGVYGTRYTRLEVHHKTYERFEHELPDDLEVVCSECHREQDRKRAKESQRRARYALEDAQLDGWASKVYGHDWRELHNPDMIEERFYEWLERRGDT